MAHAEFISPKGTIENLMRSGFSTVNCLSELIDNSMHRVKAAATMIRFKLLADNTLIVVDNGIGMTQGGLVGSRTLNQRSDATDEGQGLQGLGMKAAELGFTEAVEPVVILSKMAGEPVHEVKTDYAEIIRTDAAPRAYAHEASRKHEELFNLHAIDQEHGTMLVLKLTPRKYAEILDLLSTEDQLKNIINQFGIIYHNRLEEGFQIQFQLPDGSIREVNPIDPLAWKINRAENLARTREISIEVWEHPASGEVRCFFESNGQMAYVTGVRPPKEVIGAYPPVGYVNKGSFLMRSVFTENWHILHGDVFDYKGQKGKLDEGLGGLRFLRNDKFIHHIPIRKPTSGDTWRYPYFTNNRHNISFSSALDQFFGIQINKSKADINWNVLKTIKFLQESYSKYLCDEKENADNAAAAATVAAARAAALAAKLAAQMKIDAAMTEEQRAAKEQERVERERAANEERIRAAAAANEERIRAAAAKQAAAAEQAAKQAAEERDLLSLGYGLAIVDNKVVLHILASNESRVLAGPPGMLEIFRHLLLNSPNKKTAKKLMDVVCEIIGA